MKIDHIGIAVKNLEEAVKTYEKILHTPCYKREFVEGEKVDTAFFKTGESKVEFLVPLHPIRLFTNILKREARVSITLLLRWMTSKRKYSAWPMRGLPC